MNKNYYDILGISKDASIEDIKTIYHKLVKIYHPDINHDSNASNKIIEINEAYDVLSNPNKRKEYDLSLVNGTIYTNKNNNPKNNEWYKDYLQEKLVSINNEINDLRINCIRRILILFISIMIILILYYSVHLNLLLSIVTGYILYYSFVLSFINKPYMNLFLSIIVTVLLSVVFVLICGIVNIKVVYGLVLIIYVIMPMIISIFKTLSNLSKIGDLKRELKFFVS